MNRDAVANFAAGPSALPDQVLERAHDELMNYNGTGVSVLELSHRSNEFEDIILRARESVGRLLNVPDNYTIIFTQGGASLQFSALCLNLPGKSPLYLVSGKWSKAAADEACKFYSNVERITSPNTGSLPITQSWELSANSDPGYVYYCANETVDGVEFSFIPTVKASVPLVADFSSSFLSEPVDISKFGIIIAGAQKNLAPAGLTIVIVRNDLLGKASISCPTVMDYSVLANSNSMYNTPPCFQIYMAFLSCDWLECSGGLDYIRDKNFVKSDRLYNFLDSSPVFRAIVPCGCRSRMNVVFDFIETGPGKLKDLVEQARQEGIIGITGHRSVGGLRASLYNAQSLANVDRLITFLKQF